jgi:hypothetical protein
MICGRCRGIYSYDHVCLDHVRAPAFTRVLVGIRELDELDDAELTQVTRMRAFESYGDVFDDVAPDDAEFWGVFEKVVRLGADWQRLDPIDRKAVHAVLEHVGHDVPWPKDA